MDNEEDDPPISALVEIAGVIKSFVGLTGFPFGWNEDVEELLSSGPFAFGDTLDFEPFENLFSLNAVNIAPPCEPSIPPTGDEDEDDPSKKWKSAGIELEAVGNPWIVLPPPAPAVADVEVNDDTKLC